MDGQRGVMGKERRSFSLEFREAAVRRAAAGEKSLSQISRELGIYPSVLQTWRRRKPQSQVEPVVSGSLEDENRRLRRENASLREDREILKKAAAFFAKESR